MHFGGILQQAIDVIVTELHEFDTSHTATREFGGRIECDICQKHAVDILLALNEANFLVIRPEHASDAIVQALRGRSIRPEEEEPDIPF